MIEVGWRDRVVVVTLDRPEKHNALTIELCDQVRGAVEGARQARAIVLTGRGRSFCSGADLDEVYTAEFRDALYAMLHVVVAAPIPVVAAINGAAIGAGSQLAIAADFRVVAPAARFAVPTARIGLAVDPWTVRRLALVAGDGVARRLLLACVEIDAAAACDCGLADRHGSTDDAVSWAAEMTALAPRTQAYSKLVLNEMFEPGFDEAGARRLQDAFEACWTSEDLVEGRRARVEKRAPEFRGF